MSFSSDDFRDVYATARMAHTGQKRRSGEDYFTHPSEVRNIVRSFYPKDYLSQLAALLHDSLEDAPGSTVSTAEEMEEFIRGSIADPKASAEVIRVVRALTHEKSGSYKDYVIALVGDIPTLRVKLSDMLHNLSSSPTPKQKEKYRIALEAIGNISASKPPPGISQDHWDSLFDLLKPKDKIVKISELHLRNVIEQVLKEWNTANDVLLMLDQDGMEKADRHRISKFLKAMKLLS